MRVAPPVVLDDQQRKTLEQWARSRSLPVRQVQRAKIVLLAADGKQDLEIAATVNISNQKAARWRKRFLQEGFPGLEKDAPRPGRARTITRLPHVPVVRRNLAMPRRERARGPLPMHQQVALAPLHFVTLALGDVVDRKST